MQELEEQVRKEMEAEENSAGQMTGNDNSETQNRNIQLAEQLRDMIKEGLSDECSICLSEMTQPVITPCAHVYCRYEPHLDSDILYVYILAKYLNAGCMFQSQFTGRALRRILKLLVTTN